MLSFRGHLKLAQQVCDELGVLASSVTGVDMELKTEASLRRARTLLAANQFSEVLYFQCILSYFRHISWIWNKRHTYFVIFPASSYLPSYFLIFFSCSFEFPTSNSKAKSVFPITNVLSLVKHRIQICQTLSCFDKRPNVQYVCYCCLVLLYIYKIVLCRQQQLHTRSFACATSSICKLRMQPHFFCLQKFTRYNKFSCPKHTHADTVKGKRNACVTCTCKWNKIIVN